MPASYWFLLHRTSASPLTGPARQQGPNDQRSNGEEEGQPVGVLKSMHALLADCSERG